jgi:hypothetical protein
MRHVPDVIPYSDIIFHYNLIFFIPFIFDMCCRGRDASRSSFNCNMQPAESRCARLAGAFIFCDGFENEITPVTTDNSKQDSQ